MDVSDGINKDDARNMALRALEVFSDEIKGYYDIHFTITCENIAEESTVYPMMGSKRAGNNQVVWTNN